MIIELANKNRMEFNEIQELMDGNMRPTLRLSDTPNASELSAITAKSRFTENTCAMIKIFADDKSETPIAVYKDYKYLAFFEKVFIGGVAHVTVMLSSEKPKE